MQGLSSLTTQQQILLVTFVLVLFILLAPSYNYNTIAATTTRGHLQQQLEKEEEANTKRGAVIDYWTENATRSPKTTKPITKSVSPSSSPSASAMMQALQENVAQLREEVKQLRQEALSEKEAWGQRVQALERATYLDGSNAMHAVFQNLIQSGKPRVKLCEWPTLENKSCSFQTWHEGVLSLLEYKRVILPSPEPAAVILAVIHNCTAAGAELLTALPIGNAILMMVGSDPKCCKQTAEGALVSVRDKTVSALYLQGNGREQDAPVLQNELVGFVRKVKAGGIVFGSGYRVDVPFAASVASSQQQGVVSENERAVKRALDAYRTGEDNDLGQEDGIWIGGEGLWYFSRLRPSIFG